MARFLIALLAATVVAVQAGAQLGHAAPAAAEVFWRAVLPHSPLPDAILRLIQPAADTSFLSKARVKPPLDYQEHSRSSSDDESSKRTAGARELEYDDYSGADERRDATFNPFNYIYKAPSKTRPSPFDYNYKGPSKSQAGERLAAPVGNPFGYNYKAPSSSHAGIGASTARGGKAETTTVFFHEEAVRVGKRLPFYFPPAAPAALGFLPRQVADSVPFTTAALPGVLATFGVASDSATVGSMEATLRVCESPTIAGESKFCATSLEALVERAMGVLGSGDPRHQAGDVDAAPRRRPAAEVHRPRSAAGRGGGCLRGVPRRGLPVHRIPVPHHRPVQGVHSGYGGHARQRRSDHCHRVPH